MTRNFKRLLLLAFCCTAVFAADAASLWDDFVAPPDSAKPWCYYYWVNGNADCETVTADLEAMKKAGFGGILLLDPRGYDKAV